MKEKEEKSEQISPRRCVLASGASALIVMPVGQWLGRIQVGGVSHLNRFNMTRIFN